MSLVFLSRQRQVESKRSCTRTGTMDGSGRFAGTLSGLRPTPIAMSLRC